MEKAPVPKFFFAILFAFAALFFWLCWAYISSIILALLIASAFYPLYTWVRGLIKEKEQAASIIMTIFILLILIIPVGGFIGALSKEALDFYSRAGDSVSLQKIQQALEGDSLWAMRLRKAGELVNIQLKPESIPQLAASFGENIGMFLYRQLSSIASNLVIFLINFFLMIFIIYYIFRDGVRLKGYIFDLLPFPDRQLELIMDKFREMGKAIILGNVISGIIQGMLGGLGFYIFGLESPFFWGTVIGFMAFLPILGGPVVFIPATVILLVQGKIWAGIGFLVYNLFYNLITENYIKPRLIGKGMRMNQVLVFIGTLGGLKVFGILGIIYGPLIITILFTLLEIYRLEYREMQEPR